MKGVSSPIIAALGLSALSFSLFLQGCSTASSSSSIPVTAATPWRVPSLGYYIARLPAPPRKGSFRDRVDLEDAIAHQQAMTKLTLAHAQQTYVLSVFSFSEVLGPDFNAKNYPKTDAFFKKVSSETGFIVSGLKEHYKRVRPFAAHPAKVSLYVRNEPGYSYPSGHTTRSRLYAFLLADLKPSDKRAIYHCAETIAFDRILAGEHYQTDLEAGRKLGKILYASLEANPDFRREFEALRREEWSGARRP
jgi:acid phosphatase (class A)